MYDVESWTLWEVDRKYLGSLEMRYRERMDEISSTELVIKEVSQRSRKSGIFTYYKMAYLHIIKWHIYI